MKTRNIRQWMLYGILMLFLLSLTTACGQGEEKKKPAAVQEDTETNTQTEEQLFLIMRHNMEEETLVLYSYETGLEYAYDYSFSTDFQDKYGNFSPASEFSAGRVVIIGEKDKDGYLTRVQISDKVWEYEKVRRFSIDETKGIFTIADTKYSIQDNVFVFSEEENITLTDLSESEDILTVVGKDKKILSICVTTGHGTLALSNTTLFDGSFLQLNNDIFALISDGMEMELPEGNYTLKVANDGWGSTTEISILRGERTEVDLDTLKGEGKKKGWVSFEIEEEGIEVYIDNEKVDYTNPVELTYGTHLLKIKGDTIETWKKYLSVNEEEATISIELEKKETTAENTTDTEEKADETVEEGTESD